MLPLWRIPLLEELLDPLGCSVNLIAGLHLALLPQRTPAWLHGQALVKYHSDIQRPATHRKAVRLYFVK